MIVDGSVETLMAVRDAVSGVLDHWGVLQRRDDVVLAVDEMASNAARHVGGEVIIDLRRDEATLQVTVADGDPDFRTHGRRHPTERYGLRIIDGTADRWGVEPIAGPGRGKFVWAEFDLPAPVIDDAPDGTPVGTLDPGGH